MSELLERLKAKYPNYKILSEPDPACRCKGTGLKVIKPGHRLFPNGHESPCLCVCLSGDHRAEIATAFAESARRVKEEIFGPDRTAPTVNAAQRKQGR